MGNVPCTFVNLVCLARGLSALQEGAHDSASVKLRIIGPDHRSKDAYATLFSHVDPGISPAILYTAYPKGDRWDGFLCFVEYACGQLSDEHGMVVRVEGNRTVGRVCCPGCYERVPDVVFASPESVAFQETTECVRRGIVPQFADSLAYACVEAEWLLGRNWWTGKVVESAKVIQEAAARLPNTIREDADRDGYSQWILSVCARAFFSGQPDGYLLSIFASKVRYGGFEETHIIRSSHGYYATGDGVVRLYGSLHNMLESIFKPYGRCRMLVLSSPPHLVPMCPTVRQRARAKRNAK